MFVGNVNLKKKNINIYLEKNLIGVKFNVVCYWGYNIL